MLAKTTGMARCEGYRREGLELKGESGVLRVGVWIWRLARPLTVQYVSPFRIELSVLGVAFISFGVYWWFNPSGYWAQQAFMKTNCSMAQQVIQRRLPPVKRLYLPERHYSGYITDLLDKTDLEQIQVAGVSFIWPATYQGVPLVGPPARFQFDQNIQYFPKVQGAWSNVSALLTCKASKRSLSISDTVTTPWVPVQILSVEFPPLRAIERWLLLPRE